jgi:hypothetical protein
MVTEEERHAISAFIVAVCNALDRASPAGRVFDKHRKIRIAIVLDEIDTIEAEITNVQEN